MTKKRIIHRVLIANRAEIASRISRGCATAGKEYVCVASDADLTLPYARQAQKLERLPGKNASETYLNIEKLIAVAQSSGCDAIHPGYGFLSEREEFARAVGEAGLIFIGPRPEQIQLLGEKTRARKEAVAAGVPIPPGSESGLNDDELVKAAKRIGYPILIKASAGGGGRGMRLVQNEKELRELLPRARGEAQKFFRSSDVYLERCIEKPRHVEVQVFGDSHGKVIHLGTRDCSSQRRHQKVIEEAPAPGLPGELRSAIEKAAVKVASRVGYQNAGTAEFLVKDDEFFFLEMNTRLQVEHPVTECITGLDLIAWQLAVAEGKHLPLKQLEVRFQGHAIEYRFNAENAEAGFSPTTGVITQWSIPEAPWIRFDGGYGAGNEVTPRYDGLLGKLIVSGADRQQAIDRGFAALRATRIGGVRTNIDFHLWMSTNNRFREAPVDIGYIEREKPESFRDEVLALERWESGGARVGNVERRSYVSKRFRREVALDIEHLGGGTYRFIPLRRDGTRAEPEHQRVSNDIEAGLRSLSTEVLEVVDF